MESELRSKVVRKVKKFGQVNPVPRISTAEELADAILTICREAAKEAILNGYAETPEICKSIGVQTGIDIGLEAVDEALR